MQLFEQPFDANQVKPNEAFEALPAGWYNAKIINSECKPTKDNESGYLQFELEVIDGEHKGRKVFDRLNLWNKSVQASEIAQRQLSAYCHATGVFILQDSNQLHGIPLKIKLSIRQSEGYEPSNDVKAVKHIQDTAPSAQTNPLPPSAFPQTAVQPAAPAPFGMNPALPPQPAPVQPSGPWGAPAPVPQATVTPPAGVQPAPQQQFAPVPQQPTAPVQQAPWTPPAAPMQQPAPAAGPVPPWRR